MTASSHELRFNGAMLARGFWLYVWEVTTSTDDKHYYVGRTGDNSSINAQSPFARLSQHLGTNPSANTLRRHLENSGIEPKSCKSFRIVSYGPILAEEANKDAHYASRDVVAAMEKALAEAMGSAGYTVLNKVRCRKPLDEALFERVRTAFTAHFPDLGR